jgi:hypothetical protein
MLALDWKALATLATLEKPLKNPMVNSRLPWDTYLGNPNLYQVH